MIQKTNSIKFLEYLNSFEDKYVSYIVSDKLIELGFRTYAQQYDFLQTLQSKGWIDFSMSIKSLDLSSTIKVEGEIYLTDTLISIKNSENSEDMTTTTKWLTYATIISVSLTIISFCFNFKYDGEVKMKNIMIEDRNKIIVALKRTLEKRDLQLEQTHQIMLNTIDSLEKNSSNSKIYKK